MEKELEDSGTGSTGSGSASAPALPESVPDQADPGPNSREAMIKLVIDVLRREGMPEEQIKRELPGVIAETDRMYNADCLRDEETAEFQSNVFTGILFDR